MQESWSATAELVEAARNGSQDAWDRLVEEFSPLVVGVARATRLSATEVDDVVQVVWIRLVENLNSIRQPERLAGWIKITAQREAVRIAQRRPSEELPDIAVNDDAVEQVIQADLVTTLFEALERIGDRCRRLLQSIYLREMPYADVAAALDMPVGSVGPTRQRCLDKLRTEMG